MEFELSLRLLPRDPESIRDTLRNINDPAHASFRKFLTHEAAMSLLSYVLRLFPFPSLTRGKKTARRRSGHGV
jgi:hypothetical protein